MLAEALTVAARAGYDERHVFRMADLAMVEGGVFYCGPDGVLIAFDEGDTWFLWLVVGDPAKFFALAPARKEFISWAREQRGRPARITQRWDRLRALLITTHGRRRQKATASAARGPVECPGADCAPVSHGG